MREVWCGFLHVPTNYTTDKQKCCILRISLLPFFDVTIRIFTLSLLLFGTFLIITTLSVTELIQKLSFNVKKKYDIHGCREKQEHKF